MKKETILNNAIYVIALALAILTIIFQNEMSKILVIYGIGAAIIGLILLVLRNKNGVLVISIGVNILVTYFLYVKQILTLSKCVTFMICSSVSMIALLTIIMGMVIRRMIRKEYPMEIEATVVDLIKEPNLKKEYYKPLYVYKFKDTEYEIEALEYVNRFIPKIGSVVKISIKPDEPTEVYFSPNKTKIIMDFVGSILFIIICVMIIIKIF